MKYLKLWGLVLLFSLSAAAQNSPNLFDFEAINSAPVLVQGDSLKQAWAGGVNYAQINVIDLDLDGSEDLVIYAKKARRNLCFVRRLNGQGQPYYQYAPQYEGLFPVATGFMRYEDYNCDGLKDIFYSRQSGVYVLKNTSSNGTLSFSDPLNGQPLLSNYGSGKIPLYVSDVDMPAIIDLDGDGDLDFYTFTNSGSVVEFHENLANCGLDFKEAALCWGHFSESGLYRAVTLNACNPGKKKTMHSGSSMLILNLDGDDDYDLLLGNVSYPDITALYNGGDNDSVHFTAQDTLFPTYSTSLVLQSFPALFYEDVTFDGIPDLLASPFDVSDGSENRESILLYTNTGSSANPVFSPTQRDFMQDEMIDLGAGAVPRLVELSGDSLTDLVIANYGQFKAVGVQRHFYHYYKNVGSPGDPAYSLVDTNLADIGSYGLGLGTIPAFGDLNGDGTEDMLVGDANGKLHYFTNNSASNPSFSLQTAAINSIDVGREAAPFLYDMDEDGDLDLLVGNALGKVHYYENNSSTSPSFSLVNDYYGAIDVYSYNANIGAAVPYVFEHDSIVNIMVGSGSGGVYQYDSIRYVNNSPQMLEGTAGDDSLVSSGFERTPFGMSKRSGRNQMLVRAEELQQAGLDYGYITELLFNVTTQNNGTLYKMIVKMKNSSDTVLSQFHNDLEIVHSENPQGFVKGWNPIYLSDPFLWDGQSNLIVEICFRAQPPNFNVDVELSDVGYPANAIGDITNYNTLSAKGCEQPLSRVVSERPNIRFRITPAAALSAQYFSGVRTAPAVEDLNRDGFPDVLLGNLGGGLTFQRGKQYTVSVPEAAPLQQAYQLNVYPNPGAGRFQLHYPQFKSPLNLEVYDLNGRLLKRQSIEQAKSSIDISHFPAGVYIFQWQGNEQGGSQKVILQ